MMHKLDIVDWSALTTDERMRALKRPAQKNVAELFAGVRGTIDSVRARGDKALLELTQRFDGAALESLEATAEEYANAERSLSQAQLAALDRAIDNVRRFHEAQRPATVKLEVSPGVTCEQIYRPIEAVGLYVPAGVAPLPSAAIMLAVPAHLAGCSTRVLCTPPRKDGTADPAVLVAAKRCGIERVFKVGGAQAIAAMAYGTESIPKVDKIYGPGSSWVTAAKILVANDADGAALDLPAGPSEVLVLADDSARADFVAADLLAQAEHSGDAQVVLLTTSRALAERVVDEVAKQMTRLSRGNTLSQAIEHARLIVVADLREAIAVCNIYAPEHLILQIREPRSIVSSIRNAGAIFVGPYSPETIGDYCSGANHVLPTYGFARAFSGLSLVDFMKRMTVQELTASGIRDLGPTAITLAHLEGLDAHANAVQVRLASLEKGETAEPSAANRQSRPGGLPPSSGPSDHVLPETGEGNTCGQRPRLPEGRYE
jgi:histidinol dehydrogenase